MSVKIKGVLIDMDGTLIDSNSIIEKAWCSVANEYNIKVTPEDIKFHIYGRSGQYTLDYLFSELTSNEKLIVKRKVDSIEETANSDLIQGAEQALQYFRSQGLKIALVTASWPKRIEYILSLHKLNHYFDTIVSRNDVTKGKPNPEGYLLAMKNLGLKANECLVFEDSISGIEAGVSSGAICIGIGAEELNSLATEVIFSNFEEFLIDPNILTTFS